MRAEGSPGLRDSVSQHYQQLRSPLDDHLGPNPNATCALYHELLGQR